MDVSDSTGKDLAVESIFRTVVWLGFVQQMTGTPSVLKIMPVVGS